jgi:hypothetical protein
LRPQRPCGLRRIRATHRRRHQHRQGDRCERKYAPSRRVCLP